MKEVNVCYFFGWLKEVGVVCTGCVIFIPLFFSARIPKIDKHNLSGHHGDNTDVAISFWVLMEYILRKTNKASKT